MEGLLKSMKMIQGHKIEQVCYSCTIKYCPHPMRLTKLPKADKEALCDICEVLGPQQAIQNVYSPTQFGGIKKNPLFEEYKEPENE